MLLLLGANEVRENVGAYGAGLPVERVSPLVQRGFAIMSQLHVRFMLRGLDVELRWVGSSETQFAILAVVKSGRFRGQWVIITVNETGDVDPPQAGFPS